MNRKRLTSKAVLVCSLLLIPSIVRAQVTAADYERAQALRNKYQGVAVNVVDRANWIAGTTRFWYRKSVKGGNEFMVVDAQTLAVRRRHSITSGLPRHSPPEVDRSSRR